MFLIALAYFRAGGAAEALAEAHTRHLRQLARAGVPAGHPTAEALRDVLRQLRDADTPSACAPRIPDLVRPGPTPHEYADEREKRDYPPAR